MVFKLKNNIILKIGIIGTFVLIVLASGCICFSTNEIKTFNDGVMSFNYPADFDNATTSDINSTKMQEVSFFKKDSLFGSLFNKQYIYVARNKTGVSSAEARDGTVSKVKNVSTGQLLFSTTETNPNGVVVEKISFVEEEFGKKAWHCMMYFKIKDTVYGIAVFGPYSNREKIISTANIIFQSIK
jgi:hypothetical protein